MSFFDLILSFQAKLSMIPDEGKGNSISRSRHTEAEMIGALKQLEAGRKAEHVTASGKRVNERRPG